MADIKHTDEWLLPEDRMALVKETNHEISKLAEGMVRLLEIKRDDDFLIYHGMLARIQQLSEINFFALRLHGAAGQKEEEDWGSQTTDLKNLRRLSVGMLF